MKPEHSYMKNDKECRFEFVQIWEIVKMEYEFHIWINFSWELVGREWSKSVWYLGRVKRVMREGRNYEEIDISFLYDYEDKQDDWAE